MKKHFYTLIALGVLAGPLILSFLPQIRFFRFWPAVLISILIVGGVYVVWDILAVRWGHWRFHSLYVGDVRWLGLPPGEWLFFVAVPYACLFVYEVCRAFFVVTPLISSLWWVQIVLGVVFAVLAWVWREKGYSCLALGSVAVFWLASAFLAPGLVTSSSFWFFMGISMVAFVVVDGLYVNLPTIFYNEKAIWGRRVWNIPIEDVLYNFSLLGLELLVYLQFRGRG